LRRPIKINNFTVSTYKTIDLFCGIGGVRKGFELTNKFTNLLSAEVDKYACMTYEHLFYENPLNDVTSEEFKKKVENLNYDILLAGFPCQSFSIAGAKKGFKDTTRGTLFFDVADILKRTKPKAFLLENVEGLFRHDKGKTFKIIIDTLINELGYKIVGVNENDGVLEYDSKSFLRKTVDFGLPQKRIRTYIMGFRNDLVPNNYKFDELPTKKDKPIFNNLYDLLEHDVSAKYYLSEQYIKTLEKHKTIHKAKGNGFGYKIVNTGENPISNTILATGGSGKERNLIIQEKPEYYGIMFGSKRTPINDKGIRVMTPNEWARLQGFKDYAFIENSKDTFSFPDTVSETQQYKQLGNSVSIPVIEELAKYMYRHLEKLNMKEENMGFNKGEWSELYTFLYLIDNPNLVVVDENLQQKSDTTFKILKFILANKATYNLSSESKVIKVLNGVQKEYDLIYINSQHKLLLQKIMVHKSAKGTFEINEIQPLINDLLDGNKLKGSSQVKGDLEAIVFDSIKNNDLNISYNIKSNLGAGATLLNASSHTNFIYEVSNINDSIMAQSNNINTGTKLIDKCNLLISHDAIFNFIKTESTVFGNNLKLIDSSLDDILAQMLILSYKNNEKDIKILLSSIISDPTSEIYYKKKIGDFANAVTFGMRAGEAWNGTNEVNGGIIVVTKTGEIYLLDLIYFKRIVDKYLIDNIKLESPSSSRYKMFEIYKENNKYYFKLNLQVRFK
jgi:DNA (cytosine-5)-methyltransferase 1